MTLSIITALFLLTCSYSLYVEGWILAFLASIFLLWTRSTVLSLPTSLVRILVAPTLLFCLGLHGFYSNSLYDAGKDVWYFSGPVVYIIFGYLVFERLGSWQRLVQPLVVVGAYSCLVTMVGVVANREQLLATTTVENYRRIAGVGTFLLVLPTVLLALMRHVGLPTTGITRLTAVRATTYILSAIAVLSIFSRTSMVCLAACLVCTVNLRFTPRRVRNYAAILLGAAVLLGLASSRFHSDKVSVLLDSFVQKTANTSSELNVHGYETYQDINSNWRGFEASRAAKTYADFSDTEKLFGGGFGTTVDLGFAMKLGLGNTVDESYEFVPILHNGYMELLVKTGLLGLTLFIGFCIQIIIMALQQLRQSGKYAKLNGLLLLWTVVVFALSQEAITGILNKGALAPILLLLGATCASVSLCDRYNQAAKNLAGERAAKPLKAFGLA
jgi:O-Antigen ligase